MQGIIIAEKWTRGDSNPLPIECHSIALPIELLARAAFWVSVRPLGTGPLINLSDNDFHRQAERIRASQDAGAGK